MTEPISDDQLEKRVNALSQVSNEMLGTAFTVKGADFVNYAAAILELSQLGDVINRLANPDLRKGREKELQATGLHLIHSVDSKISTELSMEDRAEAGKLAREIFQRAHKLRMEAAGERPATPDQ